MVVVESFSLSTLKNYSERDILLPKNATYFDRLLQFYCCQFRNKIIYYPPDPEKYTHTNRQKSTEVQSSQMFSVVPDPDKSLSLSQKP